MDAFPGLVGNVSATVLHREEPERKKEKTNEPTPNTTPPDYVTANEDAIRAKLTSSVEPAYLILGANPKEYRYGRTHYDDPHYWLLDNECNGCGKEFPRYFEIEFSKPEQLSTLASRLPEAFDIILFDMSVGGHFFLQKSHIIQKNLRALYNLLKENGVFIVNYSGKQRMWHERFKNMSPEEKAEDTRMWVQNTENMGHLKILQTGFKLEKKGNFEEFSNVKPLRDTYMKIPAHITNSVLGNGGRILYMFSKKSSRGGKRRQTKRNRRARRKSSRKVPQVIKN